MQGGLCHVLDTEAGELGPELLQDLGHAGRGAPLPVVQQDPADGVTQGNVGSLERKTLTFLGIQLCDLNPVGTN